ncbi:ABC transporter permease [bacterium]|nr:ABC transporter permease [bacterium]
MYFLIESLRTAYYSLSKHRLRAILTTLGIVIGITTIITIVSLIDGLKKTVTGEFSQLGTNVLYVSKYPWISHGKWYVYRKRKAITMEEVNAIQERCPSAAYVVPIVDAYTEVKYGSRKLEAIEITGTNEFYPQVNGAYPEQGRFFSASEVNHKQRVCVLGWGVYNNLFDHGEDPLGKWIRVSGIKVRIIGVLQKRGSVFGESRDNMVLVPIDTFQKHYGRRINITIQVMPYNPEQLEQLEDETVIALRQVRRLHSWEEDDFSINSQDVLLQEFKRTTKALFAAMVAISALSLLVGGIGIMNIMLISVTERTREIGIRKAIGAKRGHILLQFLIEVLILCWVGCLIGASLGFGLAGFISAVTPLPSAISVKAGFLGLIFSSSVALFFGIYPAGKAANLNPIEALHYE